MGDEIGSVRVVRDRVDLELNAVDACDVEAVDLEGAGLVIGDRGIKGGFDVLELRDEGVLGKGILIVDRGSEACRPHRLR